MISFVRGTLVYQTDNKVEVDTGSLGYEINVPTSVIAELPPIGEDVTLYTSMEVREDNVSLYGFSSREELELFKMLITVSGIGPKGALAILSVMSPDDLRFAILSSDTASIARAPGIGKKTAEKLIIELRDKVEHSASLSFPEVPAKAAVPAAAGGIQTEAVLALTELGFSSKDAYKAVRSVEGEYTDLGELLKAALKKMGR